MCVGVCVGACTRVCLFGGVAWCVCACVCVCVWCVYVCVCAHHAEGEVVVEVVGAPRSGLFVRVRRVDPHLVLRLVEDLTRAAQRTDHILEEADTHTHTHTHTPHTHAH